MEICQNCSKYRKPMFFYLIHNLPWGQDLQPGKRNVRTLIIGAVCYILFHALLYADRINFPPMISTFMFILRRYFWFILGADFIAMSVLYKLAYGRTIFSEIPIPQMFGHFGGGDDLIVGDQQIANANDNTNTTDGNTIDKTPLKDEPKDIEVETIQSGKDEIDSNVRPLRVIDPQNMVDELQIDLLTENEGVEPDPMTANQLGGSDESQLGEDDYGESESHDQIPDEDENENENEDEYEDENEDDVDDKSLSPKLTSENIDRYVKTKPKKLLNKTAEMELKSEDLNLSN